MPRTPIVILIAVFLVASALTGATFARWMLSHQAVRGFEASFVQLCPGADPTDFKVQLRFENASETETDVRNISLLLDLESSLIASTTHRPEDGRIPPGESLEVTVPLSSNFPEYRLPSMDQCIEADADWSVRMEVYLRHPIRDDTFTLRRIRTLGKQDDGGG